MIEVTEVVWTVIGVVGIVPSVLNLRVNLYEVDMLHETGKNGGALTFAKGIVWIEGLTLLCQFCLCLVGAVAMFLPEVPPPAYTQNQEILSTAVLFSLFVGMGALAARSWVALLVRKHIYEWSDATR